MKKSYFMCVRRLLVMCAGPLKSKRMIQTPRLSSLLSQTNCPTQSRDNVLHGEGRKEEESHL